MIPIKDLTDVTLAIEEIDEEDFTNVTLVSEDTYQRLDWCDSGGTISYKATAIYI